MNIRSALALLVAGLAVLWALAQGSTGTSAQAQYVGGQYQQVNSPFSIDSCTPISSLPFTVNECGSYVLTACLTGATGQHGITVMADDVTIDLNGYTLTGVTGSLDGIHVGQGRSVMTVRDGNLKNWGGYGLGAIGTSSAHVTNVSLIGNGIDGVRIGPNGSIEKCIAEGNVGTGFSFGPGSNVAFCTAASNQSTGFNGSTRCTITDSTAQGNGGIGFSPSSDSLVSSCVAQGNTSDGIHVFLGGKVVECLAASNGRHGIYADSGAYILRNTCKGNANAGIYVLSSNCRVDDNHLVSNSTGLEVAGSGNFLVRNTAFNNSTSGLSIAAGNQWYPSGAGVTPNNPWSNWDF
jgi:parallel beta-helix repeat protein